MVLIASVAVSPTPRAIGWSAKPIHVLLRRNAESRGFASKQGEFASRDVGAYLLDHTVMVDQGPRRSSDHGTPSADSTAGFPSHPIFGKR
jgi:hypothetical protein